MRSGTVSELEFNDNAIDDGGIGVADLVALYRAIENANGAFVNVQTACGVSQRGRPPIRTEMSAG